MVFVRKPLFVRSLFEIINRPFPSCFEPPYESEAKCEVFVMKISFHSYANKTYFHMKSFALSLAFIVRFTATRIWPIENTLYLLKILLEIHLLDTQFSISD